LLIAARIDSGDPQAGASFTLASVTAMVVGGVSVFGERGTALGVLLGAIAVGDMSNALNLRPSSVTLSNHDLRQPFRKGSGGAGARSAETTITIRR